MFHYLPFFLSRFTIASTQKYPSINFPADYPSNFFLEIFRLNKLFSYSKLFKIPPPFIFLLLFLTPVELKSRKTFSILPRFIVFISVSLFSLVFPCFTTFPPKPVVIRLFSRLFFFPIFSGFSRLLINEILNQRSFKQQKFSFSKLFYFLNLYVSFSFPYASGVRLHKIPPYFAG